VEKWAREVGQDMKQVRELEERYWDRGVEAARGGAGLEVGSSIGLKSGIQEILNRAGSSIGYDQIYLEHLIT
jgi:hypothetical protein